MLFIIAIILVAVVLPGSQSYISTTMHSRLVLRSLGSAGRSGPWRAPLGPFTKKNKRPFFTGSALNGEKNSNNKGKGGIQINENWREDYDETAVKGAFEKMALGDGVDLSSMTTFHTTEDFDLLDDDFDDFDDDGDDDDFDDEDGGSAAGSWDGGADFDFDDGDMNDRLREAKESVGKGFISSHGDGKSLDNFNDNDDSAGDGDASSRSLSMFEVKPGGKLNMQCPGCGVPFQRTDEANVGYLPPHKFDELKAHISSSITPAEEDWSVDDEIDYLLDQVEDPQQQQQQQRQKQHQQQEQQQQQQIEPFKPPICQRCHGLKHSGLAPAHLTSAATNKPLLTDASFRKILTDTLTPQVLRQNVVLILVDLFDFTTKGALRTIDNIIGEDSKRANVILGVNKCDLFPRNTMTPLRAETWVRRELRLGNIDCIDGDSGDVRLISALNGYGVESLVEKVKQTMRRKKLDGVYVVGGANVGKSTLLNKMTAGKNTKKCVLACCLHVRRFFFLAAANACVGADFPCCFTFCLFILTSMSRSLAFYVHFFFLGANLPLQPLSFPAQHSTS